MLLLGKHEESRLVFLCKQITLESSCLWSVAVIMFFFPSPLRVSYISIIMGKYDRVIVGLGYNMSGSDFFDP